VERLVPVESTLARYVIAFLLLVVVFYADRWGPPAWRWFLGLSQKQLATAAALLLLTLALVAWNYWRTASPWSNESVDMWMAEVDAFLETRSVPYVTVRFDNDSAAWRVCPSIIGTHLPVENIDVRDISESIIGATVLRGLTLNPNPTPNVGYSRCRPFGGAPLEGRVFRFLIDTASSRVIQEIIVNQRSETVASLVQDAITGEVLLGCKPQGFEDPGSGRTVFSRMPFPNWSAARVETRGVCGFNGFAELDVIPARTKRFRE
jgi:hypothetical protein